MLHPSTERFARPGDMLGLLMAEPPCALGSRAASCHPRPLLLPALPRPRSKHILRGATFKIRRGEAVGIIGSSGTGKSTTLRLAAGLLAPDKVGGGAEREPGWGPGAGRLAAACVSSSLGASLQAKKVQTSLPRQVPPRRQPARGEAVWSQH